LSRPGPGTGSSNPGVNVIKLFSFVADDEAKKASVHNWQSLFSIVYHLPVTPGAYPRRKHLKGAPIGLTLALPSNSKT
jgi:hypothetical protein